MKLHLILSSAAITIAAFSAPQVASAAFDATFLQGIEVPAWALPTDGDDSSYDLARRGRGGDGDRGRDRDRGRDDDDDDDRSGGHDDGGGHRSGGHNNDVSSPNNGAGDVSGSNRRKPRIPGGSGCDDPGDIQEHASCRP